MVGRDLSLEDRIHRLEAVFRDGDQLRRSVDRLGDSAEELEATLTQVDQQQQELTRLGQQLVAVQNTTVTKADAKKMADDLENDAMRFRKQVLQRVVLTALLLLTVGAIVTVFLVEYQIDRRQAAVDVCLARNEQNAIIIEVLRNAGRNEYAQRFEELIIDCKKDIR